jgi:hypothetical protein
MSIERSSQAKPVKTQPFKIDDVVSVDLSHKRRYKDTGRLPGIVVNIFNEEPTLPEGGELAYGMPWEGPYPFIRIYIPSIVGGSDLYLGDDNGYYCFTVDQIDAGKVVATNEILVAPISKFSIGDRVTWKEITLGGDSPGATITKLPSIKDARIHLQWDGGDRSYPGQEEELDFLDVVKAEIDRMQALINERKDRIEGQLRVVVGALVYANEFMKDAGLTLDIYLSDQAGSFKLLQDAIQENCPSVNSQEY